MASPIRRLVGAFFLLSTVAAAIGVAWTLPSWSQRLPWHHRDGLASAPRADQETARRHSREEARPSHASAAATPGGPRLFVPSQPSAGAEPSPVAIAPTARPASQATTDRVEGNGTDSTAGPAAAAITLAAIMAPPPPATPPPPPLPEETELRQSLESVLARHPSTKVAYSVCQGEGEPCRARIEGRDLAAVTKAADEARAKLAGVAAVDVHELPTAYNGRLYVADIETRPPLPVPAQPSGKAL